MVHKVVFVVCSLCYSSLSNKAYFKYIPEEARSFVLVLQNWKAKKAIAEKLDAKKKLSKTECMVYTV